jgi:hypothetical protein
MRRSVIAVPGSVKTPAALISDVMSGLPVFDATNTPDDVVFS